MSLPADCAAITAELRAAGCVFAEEETRILLDDDPSADVLRERVARRVAGEPLEHVVGWAEFCNMRISVTTGVFVPRRRSEFLVRVAADLLAPDALVVDACCGSGAIGAALLTRVPGIEMHAFDVDPVAAACARRNLEPMGGHVHEGDLYAALPPGLRGRVDVIVANAPYVPTPEIAMQPREARLHEPLVALDGGADGVELHRRLAVEAPAWLAPGGLLIVETSQRQAPETAAAMAAVGLAVSTDSDSGRSATVAIGRN